MKMAEALILQKHPTAYIKDGMVFLAKQCLGSVAEVVRKELRI